MFGTLHPVLRCQCLPEDGVPATPAAVWGSWCCPGCWGVWEQFTHILFPLQEELRPRLCRMKKGPDGYGFNLHSDKNRPGQYVRAVDPGSPAEAAGLAPQDRIIEVGWAGGSQRDLSEKLATPSHPGAWETAALGQEGTQCPRCRW